jgi:predicted DNA-binding transcriptional regulator YafY
MPRADRLLELVQLLAGSRSRPLQRLVEHFGVSERTIYRDLADLQSRGIPITLDEEGYRLVDGATMKPLSLTADERATLLLMFENPSLLRQERFAARLEVLRSKLETVSPRGALEASYRLTGPDRSGTVPAGTVTALERAIASEQTVEIDYSSLSSGARSWRTLDPWALLHRSEAWYLLGRCHRSGEARHFRLDRIEGVREVSGTFARPADLDLAGWFEHSWGVFRGGDRHQIVVHFDRSVAPLIAAARHHENEEKSELPDGGVEYRVELSHLDEFARWLIGFGRAARVLAPAALITRIEQIAFDALTAQQPARSRKGPVRVLAPPRERQRKI